MLDHLSLPLLHWEINPLKHLINNSPANASSDVAVWGLQAKAHDSRVGHRVPSEAPSVALAVGSRSTHTLQGTNIRSLVLI